VLTSLRSQDAQLVVDADRRTSRATPEPSLGVGRRNSGCARCSASHCRRQRAIAQRLWDQVVLGRLQVLITNYDEQGAAASVFSPDIQHQPELRPVASLEEAGRIAGISPQLPAQIAEVYGPGTITALWGGSDRVYALWGKINAEFVARVAKTLE
jgi:hypothetical protein